ncbi:MAG: hypothetical protein HKL87_03860 [Acidimicrobiaceae bacterium]|nr:hypothetical protein [Acidimicrobiaceae bacterium]
MSSLRTPSRVPSHSVPPRGVRSRRLPPYVYWRRRVLVALAIVTFGVFSFYGITLVQALNNPSLGVTWMARVAEWGRAHGIGGFVTWAEAEYNKLNPAKVGGKPSLTQLGVGSTIPADVKLTGAHLPVPTRMTSPVTPELAGEGVWRPVGRFTSKGVPAVYVTYVRPDKVHTSYWVGVAWMDPTLLKAQLYSGSTVPGGGPYTYTAPISTSASTSLVAAFNAGFRMADAEGGYYTQGKMVLPLRNGAASAVVLKNGTLTVGEWGRDFTMAHLADYASVRQNLQLIVDGGRPVPGLDNPNAIAWGKTLGGTFNVWRSGLGVTRDGALVYVSGPALSIADLADTLVRAGAVRAMQLDINVDWTQYSYFTGPLGQPVSGANGTSLLQSMLGSPGRYFANWWTRDFYTMSLRPTTSTTGSQG